MSGVFFFENEVITQKNKHLRNKTNICGTSNEAKNKHTKKAQKPEYFSIRSFGQNTTNEETMITYQ